jgi:hypothetical protein
MGYIMINVNTKIRNFQVKSDSKEKGKKMGDNLVCIGIEKHFIDG